MAMEAELVVKAHQTARVRVRTVMRVATGPEATVLVVVAAASAATDKVRAQPRRLLFSLFQLSPVLARVPAAQEDLGAAPAALVETEQHPTAPAAEVAAAAPVRAMGMVAAVPEGQAADQHQQSRSLPSRLLLLVDREAAGTEGAAVEMETVQARMAVATATAKAAMELAPVPLPQLLLSSPFRLRAQAPVVEAATATATATAAAHPMAVRVAAAVATEAVGMATGVMAVPPSLW